MTAYSCPVKRILVVDDDPFVCETVTMLLRFDGHRVEMAGSGSQALAVFEPCRFDLIITDFFMPAMKGDELACAIKKRAPAQPVMLLTAYPERLETGGHSLAIDYVIGKPFDMDCMRAVITRLGDVQNRDVRTSQN
jgi:CheY-like chemotaxis protein